ncbi:MAG: hypothetical protein LBB60_08725 [Desulfovibrio sp.]|nr:hypothetical protein [Desulfovibrio sp.]
MRGWKAGRVAPKFVAGLAVGLVNGRNGRDDAALCPVAAAVAEQKGEGAPAATVACVVVDANGVAG